jgi:Fe-Mn family superoxide dismutase
MSAVQAQILLGVHHAGIVKRLNELTFGTIYEGHSLDSVILSTAFDAENAAIHTAACEHWNHSFAWRSLIPFGSTPSSRLKDALTTSTLKQQSPRRPIGSLC